MPSDPDDCRARARLCAKLAAEAEDPTVQRTFFELARACTEMVANIEQRVRTRGDDPSRWHRRFRIEHYWVKAAEAEENLRQADSEDLQTLYLTAAHWWADLAKDAAELERDPDGHA
jgi:hypothetical protein